MLSKALSAIFLFLTLLLPVQSWAQGFYTLTTNYPAGNAPAGLCLANLRGLGTSRDLAVANSADDTVSVRLCLDNGTFGQMSTYPVGHNPRSILFAKLRGAAEPWDDLVTANYGTNTISVLINQGVGANFAPAVDYVVGSTTNPGPRGVTFADVNGDGRPDVIVANYNESTVSVLTNQGNGVFGGLTNYSVDSGPRSIFKADMNGDGLPDIITANRIGGSISILSGQSNGVFTAADTTVLYPDDPDSDPQPVCVVAADLDGDGVMDLVTANYNSNNISILLGDASGDFWTVSSQSDLPTGTHPRSLCVRDFNHDGILDIAVANEGDDDVEVFFGNGDGTFTSQGTIMVGSSPKALAGSNFNSDQSTDLAVANYGDDNVSILMFSGPLAYGFKQNVIENSFTNVTLRGSLLSGGPLLYITNSAPTNGTLGAISSNSVVYTPTSNYFGLDSFSFQTVDTNANLTSAVATVTITVLHVNQRPSFSLSTNLVTVLEDATVTNFPGFATNMFAGADNETNQNLSFVLTTTNAGFFAMNPKISSLGTLTFRPRYGTTGTASVVVYEKDNGGVARGGTNRSFPQSFSVVVTPHPLKPHAGIYNGLFYGTNGIVEQPSSGFIKFTMAPHGLISGLMIGDGGRSRFTGQFDLTGHASPTVTRNSTTFYLDFQLDLTNGTDQVVGTVSDHDFIYANYLGDRAVYLNTTNAPPQTGLYTLVIPGSGDWTNAPGGDSYGTVSVASNGTISVLGKLSDGTGFSQSVSVSKNGYWPFYVSLLSGQGSVFSWLLFTNLPDTSLEGNVSWIRPAITAKYYPGGFSNLTAAVGSTYAPPAAGVRVLNTTNNLLIVTGGNINDARTNVSFLETNNQVSVSGTVLLKLTTPASGFMGGTFRHPTINLNRSFFGAALQQQNVARGFFLGTNQSGAFLLQPND